MNVRVATVLFSAIVGCDKGSADLPGIAPDVAATTSSSGAGGHGAAATSGAGSPGDGGGHSSVSGSRLRVARYAGADGSSVLRPEAFDSELGFYCRFAQAVDGSTRCFPLSFASYQLFADTECTVSLLMVPECDVDSRRFAVLYERSQDAACSVRSHRAFGLGEALAVPADVYTMSAGVCALVGARTDPLFYSYEIPVADLASASKEVEPQ